MSTSMLHKGNILEQDGKTSIGKIYMNSHIRNTRAQFNGLDYIYTIGLYWGECIVICSLWKDQFSQIGHKLICFWPFKTELQDKKGLR